MKHLNVPICILELNTHLPLDLEENLVKQLGMPYKRLKGSYLGSISPSYMIVVNGPENSYAVNMDKLAQVKQLAWEYGQECILFSDNQRVTNLIYSNGKTVEIGKFVQCSKAQALLMDSWTYDSSTDQYWVTKPLTNKIEVADGK